MFIHKLHACHGLPLIYRSNELMNHKINNFKLMVIDHYLFMVRTMIAEGKQSVASFGTNNLFLFKTNACVNGS